MKVIDGRLNIDLGITVQLADVADKSQEVKVIERAKNKAAKDILKGFKKRAKKLTIADIDFRIMELPE